MFLDSFVQMGRRTRRPISVVAPKPSIHPHALNHPSTPTLSSIPPTHPISSQSPPPHCPPTQPTGPLRLLLRVPSRHALVRRPSASASALLRPLLLVTSPGPSEARGQAGGDRGVAAAEASRRGASRRRRRPPSTGSQTEGAGGFFGPRPGASRMYVVSEVFAWTHQSATHAVAACTQRKANSRFGKRSGLTLCFAFSCLLSISVACACL